MTKSKSIEIWDLPLRLFHWLLVLALSATYVFGELGGTWLHWHIHSGVIVLSLLVFRIQWGFIGSTYSRFSNFFPSIKKLRQYLSGHWSAAGHNPLGSLWIVSFLLVLLINIVCGLFAINDEIDIHGPFYSLVSAKWSERLTLYHANVQYLLLFLVAIHPLAILFYFYFKQQNLLAPMITGKTPVSAINAHRPGVVMKKTRLVLATIVSGLLLWLIESDVLLGMLVSPTVKNNTAMQASPW